jgi:hypothetical protein
MNSPADAITLQGMTIPAETVQVQQTGAFQRVDRTWPMSVQLRRVLLLLPPLLLACRQKSRVIGRRRAYQECTRRVLACCSAS